MPMHLVNKFKFKFSNCEHIQLLLFALLLQNPKAEQSNVKRVFIRLFRCHLAISLYTLLFLIIHNLKKKQSDTDKLKFPNIK